MFGNIFLTLDKANRFCYNDIQKLKDKEKSQNGKFQRTFRYGVVNKVELL